MGVNRALEEAIKIWIALGGVILAFVWAWIPQKRLREGLLLALTIIACFNYARYDLSRFRSPDPYDLLHYYLNAKYFSELGYFDLYPAMIVADQENGAYDRNLNRFRFQDPERGYVRQPLIVGLNRGREIREQQFTPERWEAFEDDFLFIQRQLRFSRQSWRNLMDDRGFNGTPAWTLVASPIASSISSRNVRLLCLLDVIWLIAAMLAVRRAFGNPTMLWCIFFFFVTYSWRWAVPGLVFLRHDWVSALVIATSLIKMGRPVLAGLFTGYASLMRLFPAVFLYGVVAKAAAHFYKTRRFDFDTYRKPLQVILGFVIAVVAIEGAAAAVFGIEPIRVHAESISEHVAVEELSSRRVGFAIGYGHQWSLQPRYIQDSRKQEIAEARNERMVIAFILLLALAWGLRRSSDEEAFAFGFIPFFLLATASYYYFSIRVVLILIHASDLSKWRNRIGLALLFGFEVFCNVAETYYQGHRMFLVGGLSQLLLGYVLLMTGWLIFEARQADKDEASKKRKKVGQSKSARKVDDDESPVDERNDDKKSKAEKSAKKSAGKKKEARTSLAEKTKAASEEDPEASSSAEPDLPDDEADSLPSKKLKKRGRHGKKGSKGKAKNRSRS